MRKLIVSMNVTLDGFMSGPDCGLDWHFKSWTSEMGASLCRQLAEADTILLGRVTYTAMANYWNAKALQVSCSREDVLFTEMMNCYSKVVVSQTLKTATWNNTALINGNLAEEIRYLKQQNGKDIILYGSGKLFSALVDLKLVDEYRLWVHPVAIGKGKPLFSNLRIQSLELLKAETFGSGVVILHYQCKQADSLSL